MMRAPAKAMEARRAATGTGAVHDSAVAQPFALTSLSFSTTQAGLTTRGETA